MKAPWLHAWSMRAACLDRPDEMFFPERGGSARVAVEAAKRVCARCPVTAECLEYAMATDQRFGVWGGLSEPERRRLKRVS